MDEEAELKNYPWPTEDIPEEHFLSRHFYAQQLGGEKKRRYPSEAQFTLHENENGLSHYWNKYIELKDIFITIGLTLKKDSQYKSFEAFKIFQIQNQFIRKLNELIEVLHNPVFYGNPSPVGMPNNRSHSLVTFPNFTEEDFLQIRTELSDYCRENYDESYRQFDVKSIRDEVQELRQKENDTKYHKE